MKKSIEQPFDAAGHVIQMQHLTGNIYFIRCGSKNIPIIILINPVAFNGRLILSENRPAAFSITAKYN
jgi:hypothetical protein